MFPSKGSPHFLQNGETILGSSFRQSSQREYPCVSDAWQISQIAGYRRSRKRLKIPTAFLSLFDMYYPKSRTVHERNPVELVRGFSILEVIEDRVSMRKKNFKVGF